MPFKEAAIKAIKTLNVGGIKVRTPDNWAKHKDTVAQSGGDVKGKIGEPCVPNDRS